MNDRETIENIIETLRYYAPMASTAYNDCYASDKFYDAADALGKILQEREERSKGCAWCTGECEVNHAGKRFFKTIYDYSGVGSGEACLAYHKEDGWTLHWEDEDSGLMFDMVIDNCPMCGRKLKEEPHAD